MTNAENIRAEPAPALVDELLPCPFCGGRAHVQFSEYELCDGWHVVCHGKKDCPLYCSDPYTVQQTESRAITAWNTRTPSPSLEAAMRERDEARAVHAKAAAYGIERVQALEALLREAHELANCAFLHSRAVFATEWPASRLAALATRIDNLLANGGELE